MRLAVSLGIAAAVHAVGAAALVPLAPRAAPGRGPVEVTPVVALRFPAPGLDAPVAPAALASPPPVEKHNKTMAIRAIPPVATRVAAAQPPPLAEPDPARLAAGPTGGVVPDPDPMGTVAAGGGPGAGGSGSGPGAGGDGPGSGGGGLRTAEHLGERGASAARDPRGELLARIRAHRRYPELARRRGVQGTVAMRFSIGHDGSVSGLTVVRGADPALDEAAQEAVLAAAPLPRVDGPVEVELDFRLRERE